LFGKENEQNSSGERKKWRKKCQIFFHLLEVDFCRKKFLENFAKIIQEKIKNFRENQLPKLEI